ncbi:hypothetical protein MY8738_001227 [Beauveria namnaoensis]
MPSHRPGPLTPTPVIVVRDSGSSSREININSHAESRSTRDGGFVYNSHTTITSESTPPPAPRRPLPPSQQMSTVSSRGPRLAIGPPPSYVSSPSRSAAPSFASSSSRTARPDSFSTPSSSTTTATGSSRRYPPVSSRGQSRLPQQMLLLCDAPPSSSASSQQRSRFSGLQDHSTVTPESSVSNYTHNAEKAARRDMEAMARALRRS